LTKAAELYEQAGNASSAGFAYALQQNSLFYKGDFERMRNLRHDVLRLLDKQFNLRAYAMALFTISLSYSFLGCWDEAVAEGRKLLEVGQEFSDNVVISNAATAICGAYSHKGDLEQAIEYGQLAFEKAHTPRDKAVAEFGLARAWCRAGETERGIAVLSTFVQIARAVRYTVVELDALACLAEGYWLAGEYEEARQTAEELLELAERCGANVHVGLAHLVLGLVALETNPAQAAPCFTQCIEIFREWKTENFLALAYAGMGRYHKQQGNTELAREYLTKALEIFERLGTLIEPDKVREELADL
jgi:tetratricopeptide (TPR) repeat protein